MLKDDQASARILFYKAIIHHEAGRDDAALLLNKSFDLANEKFCANTVNASELKDSQLQLFEKDELLLMVKLFTVYGEGEKAQKITEYAKSINKM